MLNLMSSSGSDSSGSLDQTCETRPLAQSEINHPQLIASSLRVATFAEQSDPWAAPDPCSQCTDVDGYLLFPDHGYTAQPIPSWSPWYGFATLVGLNPHCSPFQSGVAVFLANVINTIIDAVVNQIFSAALTALMGETVYSIYLRHHTLAWRVVLWADLPHSADHKWRSDKHHTVKIWVLGGSDCERHIPTTSKNSSDHVLSFLPGISLSTLMSLPFCKYLLIILVQEASATIALISVVSNFFYYKSDKWWCF